MPGIRAIPSGFLLPIAWIRNGASDRFIRGRKEMRAFLQRKWAKELDYKLKKTLWGFRENRIGVSFEYEWQYADDQWYRSYGCEL
jgi:nuclear transport factor 2 (NTF2) superfamily protein